MKTLPQRRWKHLLQLLNPFDFFSKKKLFLAFEYGLILSETAQSLKIPLTPEMINRAEDIVLDAFRNGSAETVAVDMIPNILATFEPKEDNKNVIDSSQ